MDSRQWIVRVKLARRTGVSSTRYATFIVPSRSDEEAARAVKEFMKTSCGCPSVTELVTLAEEERQSDWNRFDLGLGMSGYFVPEENAARLIAASMRMGTIPRR